jgi:anti-sigma regulatory factor (Ser/Thr protein kinase)
MKRSNISFKLRNNPAELDGCCRQLETFTQALGLSKKTILTITLCIEECVANIISHGYHDNEEHWIEITLTSEDGKFIVCIEDDGVPYNPIKTARPDLTSPIEEKKIGGLGVHLMKHFMDNISYQRRSNRNVLVMTKDI